MDLTSGVTHCRLMNRLQRQTDSSHTVTQTKGLILSLEHLIKTVCGQRSIPGQSAAAGHCVFPEHGQTFPLQSCHISCFFLHRAFLHIESLAQQKKKKKS